MVCTASRVAGRSRLRPRPPPSGRTGARRSQAACQHIARPPRVLVTLPGLPWPLCHPLAAVVLLKIPRGPRGPWRPRRPLGPAPLLGSRGQPAPAAPAVCWPLFFTATRPLLGWRGVQPLSTFCSTCLDLFCTRGF